MKRKVKNVDNAQLTKLFFFFTKKSIKVINIVLKQYIYVLYRIGVLLKKHISTKNLKRKWLSFENDLATFFSNISIIFKINNAHTF
jgi:hypothetical protein